MTSPIHDEEDEVLLAPSFAALRTASSGLGTPPRVEQDLLAALARQVPKKRWYQRLSVPQWGMAGGLSTAMAVLVLMPALQAPGSLKQPAAVFEGDDFIALESRERIELEASPQLVAATLPRTALVGLGIAITPQTAGDSVRAELLVGADGQPLALRLLPL